jgi:hypothetical protein
MNRVAFDRVVIGGGLFGSFASLILARQGYSVCLIDQGHRLLDRASYVNQARLHTGLHYPRSLVTARETALYYQKFRSLYPSAVRDFRQIYAVSRYSSKTSSQDFIAFIARLGIDVKEVSPSLYFHESSVSSAFEVEEPTFDAAQLRNIFTEEIKVSPNITVLLGTKVIGGSINQDQSEVFLHDGRRLQTSGLVISAYAGINGLRKAFGLELLPLSFEIADVHIGRVPKRMRNLGFTVMDGPFWSLMPFGHTEFSSLTSVGLTPIDKSHGIPLFSCQTQRDDCSSVALANCSNCNYRPMSNLDHILQQVSLHLKGFHDFTLTDRLTTVKAILTSSEVDDSRPSLIQKEKNASVWTIFSGKVTTLLDIEKALL